jgi:hypothetical protein
MKITDDLGMLFESIEQGNDEGSSLSTPGSTADHYVPTFQNVGDGFTLHWGRHVVPFVHHRFENWPD